MSRSATKHLLDDGRTSCSCPYWGLSSVALEHVSHGWKNLASISLSFRCIPPAALDPLLYVPCLKDLQFWSCPLIARATKTTDALKEKGVTPQPFRLDQVITKISSTIFGYDLEKLEAVSPPDFSKQLCFAVNFGSSILTSLTLDP
eukprot:TRINITY_DN1004_c0_g1_i1.p1 TRINITY_DN1004_c0_g1~~TRINITY_DN1004_c0_g1_i1.p1  ORF type:complete len:146 (+),score=15.83 TRINITY_DN1004_c0_g1_i1:747-1184(+)